MAQVALIKLTGEWETLEDLISEATGTTFTFDTTKTYQIECRGASNAFLLEQSSEPSDDSTAGVMLQNDGEKIVKYKKGTATMYARAVQESALNITVLGE